MFEINMPKILKIIYYFNNLTQKIKSLSVSFSSVIQAIFIIQGIVFTEGTQWVQTRRFTMRHLRTFGIGQSVMKEQLVLEAQNLIDYLQQMSESGAVTMHTAFDIAVINSLWFMIAGHKFKYGDQKTQEALTLAHNSFK